MLNFKTSRYRNLPSHFYQDVLPEKVQAPALVLFNAPLAKQLQVNKSEVLDWLSGNDIAQNTQPIATAYAGHQFGHFVPQLGDGRAHLLGEITTPDGSCFDVQLKGSGRTIFSRRGDGKCPLGPALREYLISEFMHAVGIPTTRVLTVITTGEQVQREDILPGAVLSRIASSHVRVGSFEYFAYREDHAALKALSEYVIARHYPESMSAACPYRSLLERVTDKQAKLIAQWMAIGFVHGVMNTDNMTLSGETIDFGPCAFIDAYQPAAVYSYIDQYGRYAYGNQPHIGLCNLVQFTESLFSLLTADDKESVLESVTNHFSQTFNQHYQACMREKLGLSSALENDNTLINNLLEILEKESLDYTNTFRHLANALESNAPQLISSSSQFACWFSTYQQRIQAEQCHLAEIIDSMNQINPAYIPRNYLVEAAIDAVVENGDMSDLTRLLSVLQSPYTDDPTARDFTKTPTEQESACVTFCGT